MAQWPAPGELPWFAGVDGASRSPGYEDWYMVDDWAAVGVLRQAAVSGPRSAQSDRGSRRRFDRRGLSPGRGERTSGLARVGVWVAREGGHEAHRWARCSATAWTLSAMGCGGDARLGPRRRLPAGRRRRPTGRRPTRRPSGWVRRRASRGKRCGARDAAVRYTRPSSRLALEVGSTTGKRRAAPPRAWAPSDHRQSSRSDRARSPT